MKKKIYKYFSSDVIGKIFSKNEYVGFKCTYPKYYNDPYELFLTVDPTDVEPEHLAYYHEIVGEVPQLPTTCFSKKPNIVPMWAHYAKEHSGCVVEIDEEMLINSTHNAMIEDVTYADKTGSVDMEMIKFACVTAKPRHTLRVQKMAFKSAYFTKNNCWEYEFERRVVLSKDDISEVEDIMVLEVPADCVTAIITGALSEKKTKSNCLKISQDMSCNYYEMAIGRSSVVPYFMNLLKESFVFDGNNIVESSIKCEECGEPIYDTRQPNCHWCSTDDSLKYFAATRNPMRMLEKLGLLKDYMKENS